MNRRRVLVAFTVAAALVAGPAWAVSNPKTSPVLTMGCPGEPSKVARYWVTPGKTWTAENQCGGGVWLLIGWNGPGSSDSTADLVLVAPHTRFGPKKSAPVPGVGGWTGASLTTHPEFADCQGGTTWVVWPNSRGAFDITC